LYEYNRNTATAANTWFNNQAGVPRQPLVRNQFGGSAGGKIVRDRPSTSSITNSDRMAAALRRFRAVPSDTLRQGIFKIYDV